MNAVVPLDRVLNVRAFDISRVLAMEPDFLGDSEHSHDTSVSSVGLVVAGSLNITKMQVRTEYARTPRVRSCLTRTPRTPFPRCAHVHAALAANAAA